MNPLVSILIPVYNRVSLVGETIESARNQTYQNIEIVIVDNCSTDGTWEFLQEYSKIDSRIRIYQNTKNIGPVMNWEKGIEYATGEFITMLFSDDRIDRKFIEISLNLIDKDTAFVISKVQVFKENFVISSNDYLGISEISSLNFIKDKLGKNLHFFPVSPCSALFRYQDLKSNLIVKIPNPEKLDFEKFGAGNDMLIFLLIARLYKKIKFTNEYLVFFRNHNESISVENKLEWFYYYAGLYFVRSYKKNMLFVYKIKIIIKLISQRKFAIIPKLLIKY